MVVIISSKNTLDSKTSFFFQLLTTVTYFLISPFLWTINDPPGLHGVTTRKKRFFFFKLNDSGNTHTRTHNQANMHVICLSVCMSVCLSVCLSIYISIYPSIHLSIYLSYGSLCFNILYFSIFCLFFLIVI